MEFSFTGGKLGELFVALSFAGALVATLSFFIANYKEGTDRKSWQKIGKASFFIHGLSIIGIFSTLFYLIFTRQYQYFYVWDHSSNELPVHYMISCFWEGQEGSFLLWQFWHSVLGAILIFTAGKWRDIVLSVIASVELILSTMVLGIFVGMPLVYAFLLIILTALSVWLVFRQIKSDPAHSGIYRIVAASTGVVAAGLLIAGESGFYTKWKSTFSFDQTTSLVFLPAVIMFFLLLLSLLSVFIYRLPQKSGGEPTWYNKILQLFTGKGPNFSFPEILAGLGIFGITYVLFSLEPGSWKIGSTPFLTLKVAFPDEQIWQVDPDFVPDNGNGLNSLLQNYWMVIHPPTLFLGFAATVVPFAYVIGGLINRKYTEWIRPATPWTLFSVAILGTGIIMGGYWAYETLNFGGYWNWDPVENASLVPWLIGIGSVHAMLAYRKSKNFLLLTMGMVIATFLLVLYSTFLTRSGILGDTSVHTFTDLGLSGQLLVLLFIYFMAVFALIRDRLPELPKSGKELGFWSKEFFLFLGTLVFIFSGLGITLSTSLPVLNKIFGTNLAAPAEIQFFYYKWNVWFAILIGVLSGIGQFLYWRKEQGKDLWNALFRPFLVAVLAASAIVLMLAIGELRFSFEPQFHDWLETAEFSDNLLRKISLYVQFGIFIFADEFLLASALFIILANLDVLIHLIRKNKKRYRITGGSVAHVGFGLMLLGILLSSGFDHIVTKNLNPGELASFGEEEDRRDNVLLLPGRPRMIDGYQVTYTGKKQAVPPVSDVEIIEENPSQIRVKFDDAEGNTFSSWLDKQEFQVMKDGELDIDRLYLKYFLDETITFAKPEHINGRSFYGLNFRKTKREGDELLISDKSFTLWPEAEPSGKSIISHPARRIFPDKDLYVFVSSIPVTEDFVPRVSETLFEVGMGDTAYSDSAAFVLKGLAIDSSETDYDLTVRAELEIWKMGEMETAYPAFRATEDNLIRPGNYHVKPFDMLVSFLDVDYKRGKMKFIVRRQTTFPPDYVVISGRHKPWINLLWLGTFVLVAGFGIAIYRRASES